jgi:hypothetical protein
VKSPIRFVDGLICGAMSAVMCLIYRQFDISPQRHGLLIQASLGFMASVLAFAILASAVMAGRASIKDALEIGSMVFIPLVVAIPLWRAFLATSNKYDRMMFTDMSVSAEFTREWEFFFIARLLLVVGMGYFAWLSISFVITASEPGVRGLMAVVGVWIPLSQLCLHYIRAASPPPPSSGRTAKRGFSRMQFA